LKQSRGDRQLLSSANHGQPDHEHCELHATDHPAVAKLSARNDGAGADATPVTDWHGISAISNE